MLMLNVLKIVLWCSCKQTLCFPASKSPGTSLCTFIYFYTTIKHGIGQQNVWVDLSGEGNPRAPDGDPDGDWKGWVPGRSLCHIFCVLTCVLQGISDFGQLCYGLYVPRRGCVQVTGLIVDCFFYITGRHGTVSKLSTNSPTLLTYFSMSLRYSD